MSSDDDEKLLHRTAILTIETSHSPGSVALVHEDRIHASVFPDGLVHGRELFPRLAALVSEVGARREQLGLVAVSAGPGSFTGIRIGVSAAKTIAWALGLPTLAISTLRVIACNVSTDGEFAVVLDARRGACYGARFRRRGDVVERVTEDQCCTSEEFFASLPDDITLVGEGISTLPGTGAFARYEPEWSTPRAAQLCALARTDWNDIRSGDKEAPPEFDNPHALLPCYLRATEAEERRKSRES